VWFSHISRIELSLRLLLTFVVRSHCPWGRKGQLWALLVLNWNNWLVLIVAPIWLKLLALFMRPSVVIDPWTFLARWENLLYVRFKTFDSSLLSGYVTQPLTPFLTHVSRQLGPSSINFNLGEKETEGLQIEQLSKWCHRHIRFGTDTLLSCIVWGRNSHQLK
jgi:hypothetical protein